MALCAKYMSLIFCVNISYIFLRYISTVLSIFFTNCSYYYHSLYQVSEKSCPKQWSLWLSFGRRSIGMSIIKLNKGAGVLHLLSQSFRSNSGTVSYITTWSLPFTAFPSHYSLSSNLSTLYNLSYRRRLVCNLWFASRRSQYLRPYCVEWHDDWWIMNWEGFARKGLWSNRDTVPEFACRDWGKPQNSSVRIADFPAQILTEYLPNASPERCSYTDRLILRVPLYKEQRRGMNCLVVHFSDKQGMLQEILWICFGAGLRPNITKGTKAVCTVSDKGRQDDDTWHARIVGKDESSMNVEVSRTVNQTYIGFVFINALTNDDAIASNDRVIDW
jgi:hypothetical protein